MNPFKGRHFQRDIILWAVRWYCKYGISYRELQEMLAERGVNVDHSTIYRWVQRYAPEMEKRLRWYWRNPSDLCPWHMDETYVKVNGRWAYLYRAVDSRGRTVDFYLSSRRNSKAAYRFLGKILNNVKKWQIPRFINTDKAPAYGRALALLKREGRCPSDVEHRQIKYRNNVIECDHGKLKRIINATLGFKSMKTAYATIKGIEVMRGLSSVNAGLNLQESNKWGNSSQFNFWSSGPLVDDSVSLQVRGSTQQRQGSSVTSLSDTAATRIPYPTESQNYNLGARLDWKASAQDVLWFDMDTTRQRYDNRDGQLGSLTGGYDRTLRYERNKISAGYDHTFTFGTWKSYLNWNETENKGRELVRSVLKRDKWGLAGQPRELKESNLILNSLLLTPLGESHLVTVGGEFQSSSMKDGVVLASTGETFRQKSWSVFAEDEWHLTDALALTVGSRYEHHEQFGGHFSPRAYLVWDVADAWTLKGGVTTGYKAPRMGQLHKGISGVSGQGKTNLLGNPDLKPEESVSYEAGVYYDNPAGLNANVTGFMTDFSNKIVSYSINDNTNSYVNSGKARLHGVEFAGILPLWSEDVTLSLNYTWTRSEQRDGDNKGAPLSYTPEHMVNAKLNWQITEEVASWLGARYRGKTPRFTQNYSSLSAVQKKVYDEKGEYLKAWTVVDAGLSWKMTDALTLNAAVNNLLNKDYSDVSLYSAGKSTLYAGDYFQTGSSTTGYVIPERNYWMSLNYQF
ncbi:TonB-dependent receptor [Escherichia coli]|nr:TonB-dependent receptor [Escherichia coli]